MGLRQNKLCRSPILAFRQVSFDQRLAGGVDIAGAHGQDEVAGCASSRRRAVTSGSVA